MKVAFHPLVIDYLEELTFKLYEKDYFGFYDAACEYVDKMVDDISSNIHIKAHQKALHILINMVKICFIFPINPRSKLPGTSFLMLTTTVI